MYLKSIELSGFKSFAKKSDLKFTSPISAIVGPNGSGKSNVAEAFRFVLGEQSIKSLRGKRGEDLIFNGAGSEARANRASVKVVFDNTEKAFAIDFPEVSIERVVHRDGINEYLINGSQVRLKDVLELLAQAHIGASGHHIISQGEADKILNASTKERKGMIEDALGLKLYQYKRVESERKLKKTFENIAQVEGLRKEIAPHLKFLKKQAEKIEKAEGLRGELLALAHEYFKREEGYLTTGKDAIKKERGPIETSLQALDKELKAAKQVLADAGKEGDKNFKVLDLESEIAAARVKKDTLSRELGQVEGALSAEERTVRKERELQASEEHKMIRLKDVEILLAEVSLLQVVSEIIQKLKNFVRERKASEHSGIILEAEKEIERLKQEKKKIEEALKGLADEERKLQAEYEKLKKEIEKAKDSSRESELAVFRIMSEEQTLNSRLDLLKSKEEHLRLEEAEFERELEEISRLVGAEILQFRDFKIEVPDDARTAQEERKRNLDRLKVRLEDSGLSGASEVMKEFTDVSERDAFLSKELLDLDQSATSLKELIKSLEERLAAEFAGGIKKINNEFGELFKLMFGGGDAQLTLTKERKTATELDELEEREPGEEGGTVEEGLDISVNLPRKKIKGLMMLSGGERALTSIALLFAISSVNPPPFIILDETDAALDEANSKKYGDLAEKLSKHSQLILITHNRETMSRAGVIYGVTMSSGGVSKLLSIQFEEAVQVAK